MVRKPPAACPWLIVTLISTPVASAGTAVEPKVHPASLKRVADPSASGPAVIDVQPGPAWKPIGPNGAPRVSSTRTGWIKRRLPRPPGVVVVVAVAAGTGVAVPVGGAVA